LNIYIYLNIYITGREGASSSSSSSRPEGSIIQIEEDVAVGGLKQDEEDFEKKKFLDELYLGLELPHRCSKDLLAADAARKRQEAAEKKAVAEAKVVILASISLFIVS
jgi:hypothetical protein